MHYASCTLRVCHDLRLIQFYIRIRHSVAYVVFVRAVSVCGCVRVHVHQAIVKPALLLVGSTDGACAAVARECCSRLEIPVLSLADDSLRLSRLLTVSCDSEAELPA
eukprot:COSAG02_NODE_13355_length_1405_cov_0.912711_2_plen_106_part_01